MKKSRAATRTIKILEVIANESKGLTLSEIAAKLDIPITSASDIVRSLLDEGMVEVIDERSKVYGIGVTAYYIGNAFIANTSIVDKAKAAIEELSNKTNKTVFLGKEVQGKITYIYKHEPKETLVATCDIGSRTNLHCTSLGKSFLAYNEQMFESLRGKELIRKTAHTITDFDKLEAEVKKVRIQGYAIDDREQNDHLLCIGAPIFDSNRNVVAAISISGLYSVETDVEEQARLVKEAALTISRRIGYS
ncbi:IclR family transcriptional regulator [Spirochaeta isovalerica]|uniref:DNA-binding IclR family transcriptional regulator n=1 Tax=Spirochaeta isovalerica TaxID=150 RepID=A0A841R9I2_9SPIO|nr:IclR family transcriptional regulator [Spirochaeta isovalerica]MBB6479877.1 DNA-binding IclR family transcriptional regulator [Spirochaeta isovalerica]